MRESKRGNVVNTRRKKRGKENYVWEGRGVKFELVKCRIYLI